MDGGGVQARGNLRYNILIGGTGCLTVRHGIKLARATNYFKPDGFTALQLASYFGHPETVKLLLGRGAAVNAVARNGMAIMPLHAAVPGQHHAVVEALLAAGADVNARQHGGWAALHGAAQHGDRRLVEMLLAAGADPSLQREGGETPSQTAAAHGHVEIAGLLTAQV